MTAQFLKINSRFYPLHMFRTIPEVSWCFRECTCRKNIYWKTMAKLCIHYSALHNWYKYRISQNLSNRKMCKKEVIETRYMLIKERTAAVSRTLFPIYQSSKYRDKNQPPSRILWLIKMQFFIWLPMLYVILKLCKKTWISTSSSQILYIMQIPSIC